MKFVARLAQRGRRLGLTDNLNHASTLLQLAAQADEIRIAADNQEVVNTLVKQHFEGIECQFDISGVLPSNILKLHTGGKSMALQCIAPLVELSLIAVATSYRYPAQRRCDPHGVIQYYWLSVLDIDEDSDSSFRHLVIPSNH